MSSSRSTDQHYIPAAYIGQFASAETRPGGRRRRRAVWVRTRGVQTAFLATPEARAKQVGIYDTESEHLGGHLDYWFYEANLPMAMAQLADPSTQLEALTWLETLVRFVSGLWVRGPDRNRGVNNDGRVIEYQEVLAPVMAADWTVLHYRDDTSLVTSDRGFAIVTVAGEPAMVVPLDPHTAVLLTDRRYRVLPRATDGTWIVPIRHQDHPPIDSATINHAIAIACIRDIYGSTQQAVDDFGADEVSNPHDQGLPFLLVDTDLRAHIYDWFRLLAALRAEAGHEQVALDDAAWSLLGLPDDLPIAVELANPERTLGGVYFIEDRLVLSLIYGSSSGPSELPTTTSFRVQQRS